MTLQKKLFPIRKKCVNKKKAITQKEKSCPIQKKKLYKKKKRREACIMPKKKEKKEDK